MGFELVEVGGIAGNKISYFSFWDKQTFSDQFLKLGTLLFRFAKIQNILSLQAVFRDRRPLHGLCTWENAQRKVGSRVELGCSKGGPTPGVLALSSHTPGWLQMLPPPPTSKGSGKAGRTSPSPLPQLSYSMEVTHQRATLPLRLFAPKRKTAAPGNLRRVV